MLFKKKIFKNAQVLPSIYRHKDLMFNLPYVTSKNVSINKNAIGIVQNII